MFKHIRNLFSHDYSKKVMDKLFDELETLQDEVQELQTKAGVKVRKAAGEVEDTIHDLQDAVGDHDSGDAKLSDKSTPTIGGR